MGTFLDGTVWRGVAPLAACLGGKDSLECVLPPSHTGSKKLNSIPRVP